MTYPTLQEAAARNLFVKYTSGSSSELDLDAATLRAGGFWRSVSLPYPEHPIRLIRQDEITAFNRQLSLLRTELAEAVQGLDENYLELRDAARQRLGSLYNEADYPSQHRKRARPRGTCGS